MVVDTRNMRILSNQDDYFCFGGDGIGLGAGMILGPFPRFFMEGDT